jgi:hypothetical protein
MNQVETTRHKVEPTPLQRKTADNIIQNVLTTNRPNKKDAILRAGGSPSTARCPKLVTESQGFKAYMEKVGLTDDNLALFLAEDIRAKAGNRLGELKLAIGLKGYNTDNVNLDVTNKRETELLREILDKSGLIEGEIVEEADVEEQLNVLKGDVDEQSIDNN